MEASIDQQGRQYNRFWFIFTLLAGTFTMSISQSSLSTAYPTLMHYFNLPASTIQWLTTGFMLIMCVTMPISSWLLNNLRFKPLFLSILAIFDIGTLIIVVAPTFWLMMLGRVMEAVAVGVLFPSFQTVLLTITPKKQRATTMGTAGLVMGSALACGPIVSGIVLNYFTWRGLFVFFMVVITLVFLLAIGGLIRNVMPLHPATLDFWSVILSVGLIGILYVVNQIGKTNVNWLVNIVILVVSIAAMCWFVVRQFRLTTPLLELRVLKTLNFDLAVLLTGVSYIALIVTTIIFPLYYQEVLHVSPFISGMALVPAAVFLSILNPLTGKLADKLGFRFVMLTGMSMIVVGWLAISLLVGHLNLLVMILCAMIIEGGNAFVMMPAVTMGANSLPSKLVPDGTAVTTTIRQILGSTGVAAATLILGIVMTRQVNSGVSASAAQLGGYRAVFLTFFGIALIGWLLAWVLKNPTKQ
ncbi:MFS transporter [Paucilactobacillus wasatchensis]|uniref:Permease of the major facilitator superfamily n=1 Tax=Paucilactobacillus wasatchensis TaxID=1335616 RepID=A0A0D1A4X7_9LACO|nr:MFS transporter [Paucilactobacillus wasatchensis]KIS02767.1 Permease of the major facilitator superfamily [Paucilactobacillus wasatchensis]